MKLFIKIISTLAVLVVALFGSFIFLTFVFVVLWGSGSVNGLSGARELLKEHGHNEHRVILHECIKLIENGEDVLYHQPEIPDVFKPLMPEYVRASSYSCEVNLFKAPGKGIGYWVKQTNDGYQLSWADHFVSWDNHRIDIE